MSGITTVDDFRDALNAGIGNYPMFFLCDDGGTLSFKAAVEQQECIESAIELKENNGWRVVAVEINYEDEEMICDHTNEPIACAFPTNKGRLT